MNIFTRFAIIGKKKIVSFSVILISLFLLFTLANASDFETPLIKDALKKLGAVSYSHKPGYSRKIQDIYLAYDLDKNVIGGIVYSKRKIYDKISVLFSIQKKEDAFYVNDVQIPDLDAIHDDSKRRKVFESIEGIEDTVIIDQAGSKHDIDAVTGATFILAGLYSDYDEFANTIIKEIKENPNWQRLPL